MRSAPVVAAQASQHNPESCTCCGAPLEGPLSPHLCSVCGEPLPVSAREDYFSALGAKRAFRQDAAALQRKFYELSRALHPDRFSTAKSDARQRSLDRMSFLNQAYQTLKDPDALAAYLLELEGVRFDQKSKSPALPELAEAWFELQEGLAEFPDLALVRLQDFSEKLQAAVQEEDRELELLKRSYDAESDASAGKVILEKISRRLLAKNYLRSLSADVERMKVRAGR